MQTGEGGPVPGKKYDVELAIEVFETNVPPQYMWMPGGDKYKVLYS